MEVNNNRFYRLKWFWNILSNGLLLFGIRNRLAQIGLDIDPYYWVEEGYTEIDIPKIKEEQNEYSIVHLNLDEIHRVRKKVIANTPASDLPIFNDKQKAIGVKYKNEIAAFMFIELEDFYYHKRKISLNKNEAYLFHMYTFENHRGKNLAPYLRYHSYLILKELGIKNIYSITQYFNTSSKNFKRKLSAQNKQLYLNITLFKKYRYFTLLRNYSNLPNTYSEKRPTLSS
ncbi:hypothetical protein [Eudoraea chungangensis]|uniref:hypothetical protein n=1 Tax=Eudoraea chungangensis TaxID=1481905 RepID=UPI0023ED7ED8|nr:hypothetical protein [Eudoraea chungangensis]